MDARYQEFCLVDPVFYDTLAPGDGSGDEFEIHRRPLPKGWRRIDLEGWRSYAPQHAPMPSQGWKVHACATPQNAQATAATVWDYCIARQLPFKIVTGPLQYLMKNSKYTDRAGSGKLVTVYPADEEELRRVLEGLGALLDGWPGPYILSDLRWREGPLYVRYGSFLHRPYADDAGQVHSGIEDPQGHLVPDPRGPVFRTPPWVTVPALLQPELERRGRLTVDAFPYEIVRALHFSNGGGVYEAKAPATGRKLIVKEARRHAGLDAAQQDAVTRLRHERDVLQRLSGLPCVPALVDYRTLGENEYLVEEFSDGVALNDCFGRRNPLMRPGSTPAEYASYGRWAQSVWSAVAQAIEDIHDRGIVHGDLHPFNIIVHEDTAQPRVVLVDLEVSAPVEQPRRPTLEHPGFGAPGDRQGFAVDHYALAALRLALFMPLTTLLRLDHDKAHDLADLIAATFDLPRRDFDETVAVLSGEPPPTSPPGGRDRDLLALSPGAWPRTRDSLAAAISASSTPDRTDRLFPGDIEQFTAHGGLGFAHGAAGVLWARHVSGTAADPDGAAWLARRTREADRRMPPGFYDGAHGIAHTLWELGHLDQALALVERTAHLDPEQLDSSLYSGLSGIGLNLLTFAQHGQSALCRSAAERIAALVSRRVAARNARAEAVTGTGQVGLMRGASGPALFLTAMFEADGDPSWLDAAATALRLDLRRCVTDTTGSLKVNEGWRVVPYLNTGSVGIGFALRRYLRHRPEPELADALHAAAGAARSSFYAFSGLFDGRAGMVLFHATGDPADLAGAAQPPDALAQQVQALNWHRLHWQGHLAFPGNQLLRLSMDLASGSAGVLLALAAAHGVTHHGRPVSLPFLQ
ncbi:class III lanthionine synthetase LanKC [Streptomyces sp. NPDC002054]|uniref:class III lanthionine synthetase LanKC n=1 Tax=Streptomyces sp. NPDC002054 TaxID=3154663 RepID=UPI003331F01A